MSRRTKIPLIVLGALAGLLLVIAAAAFIVIQTGWFRNAVRERTVAEIEKSTGGRAEIGSFEFDPKTLRAVVRNFVLHGTEGPGEPPLFRAQSIEVVLKIVSVFKRQVDIYSLTVEKPQGYVRVAAAGATNLPTPKVKSSGKDPIQTVLDLAIRRFTVRDGSLQFAQRRMPLDVRGENLRARLDYDIAGPRYSGNIAMAPVYVKQGANPTLPVDMDIGLRIEQGSIEVTRGAFRTRESRIEVTGAVNDLKNPHATLRLNGRVAPLEWAAAFGRAQSRILRRAPPVEFSAACSYANGRLDIAAAQVGAGRSRISASGAIESLKELTGALRFEGSVALGDAGHILQAASRPEGTVKLAGDARFAGKGRYAVTGNIFSNDLAVNAGARRIRNIRFRTAASATPGEIRLAGLRLDALGGSFTGGFGLRDMDAFHVQGALRGFELRQLARDFSNKQLAWDGVISGPVNVNGRLRGPFSRQLSASAQLRIVPGSNGIPVSGRIDVSYDGPRDTANLGKSFIQLPATRVDLTGSINQQLRVRLVSRDLNDFLPAIALAFANPPQKLPVRLDRGQAIFDGAVTGRLTDPVINGRVSMTRFAVNEQTFDSLAADLNAASNGASVRNASLQRGKLVARVTAHVGLKDWKTGPAQPVEASASIRNATLKNVLAAAGKAGMPLTGDLSADAEVTGTVGDPRAGANLLVSNATAYGEPVSELRARVEYAGARLAANSTIAFARNARVNLTANYRHQPQQYGAGRLTFQVNSAGLRLENVKTLHQRQPGLQGSVDLNAKGDAEFDNRPGRPRVLFSLLDATLRTQALEVNAKRVGNLVATAQTSGRNLLVDFHSDLAQSDIRGKATWVLAGDYPVQADINFSPVRIGAIRELVSPLRPGQARIDGVIEGRATVSGPSTKPDLVRGFMELSRVELNTAAPERPGQPPAALALRNAGPVRAALDRSTLRVEQARFTGPETDLSLGGAVYIKNADMFDLNVNGTVGLALLRRFDNNIYADGKTVVRAAIRGNPSQPLLDGRVEFRKASVNYTEFPNGISNADGVILFNGEQAVIQSFNAESGGGKVALAGFMRYAGDQSLFRIQATAEKVRVRFPPNASTVVNAALDLDGTAEDSRLSGTVTILETAYYSNTDFGSLLSEAGTPPRTPATKTGMLAKMRLNVRIQTAQAAQFQTTLAQNLKADVNLEVRGTAARPGLVGRANVTQGEIMFFGAKYRISAATISFYNPQRIEPVLNVDLETQARSVQVFLSVNGPMDQLKLSYRSEPPLPFSDIVSLLATGKAPSTDPVLAAKQPPAPEQSWQQVAGSTLLGQAIANPVSGRLQRLFGVTKLKIDPQVSGAENSPQARLTMEQQITKDLTFTYIQDTTQSNPQIVRVEWAIDPTWSAVALRQENGQFGVDFYYKKRFR